ncbi:uncharacterized protein PV09_07244 [Verruconis gallopava]|uniref:Uncharacterized protein n=1 Tax=Verruconis gallopava TaxID=253628 RepID=A0A0D2A3Z9_9PEZI|nr:uncharacterized protein PV09_07244 [Verruconis gallopava]KIW01195.1 hypothetical protein PV09_07244 [Verruconis gallopava]
MMTTFPPQGGMPQHPGMPHGQPMPGGVPHPQAMAGPMQMHPGVSAPHGQQVSQAPMMGMQPGMVPGGPSAHAMSHLAPNAGQMMQQPGMPPQGMNPQFMHLNQQQRMMAQRQWVMQRQAQMGAMHQPGQPGPFNPQQIAALHANGQMANLPPHLQQQIANTQMFHQQSAMQEAARQQQMQNTHAAQQQAHHIAMQHAASQNSSQGHPTTQPGQPNQPPMRPASATAGTTGMEARPSPAATAGPQSTPQPGTQNSQTPSQTPQQPQTSGPQAAQAQTSSSQPQPNQTQTSTQQQAAQGQPMNPGQTRPGLPQNMNPQQMHAAVLRQQAVAAAAQAQSRAASGQTLLAAFNFASKLGAFKAGQQQNDFSYWQAFVQQHFTDDAIFRLVLPDQLSGDGKTFQVHAAGLARYFYTQFQTDIDQVQLVLDGSLEKTLSETHTLVIADRSRMLYWFRDGTQLVWNGFFTILYNNNKIEHLNFETHEHETYLPRTKLEELCVQTSPNQNRSPKLTKTKQQKGQQPSEPAFDMRRLPSTQITVFGIHKRLQAYLELAETMNAMEPLITFSRERPHLSVPQALSLLVESYNANPPNLPNFQQPNSSGQIQGAFPPGGVQGSRPPGMMQSPALSNSGLPVQANGATPSPHQNNMAPPMQPSMSQTSHHSGSNTSPNVGGGNKRRRSTAAGVKGEEDVNGGAAPKVKQSPRMTSGTNNNKRMKGS